MERLAGKVAVITGGGRGLGRAIALGFAREGASVVICARTAEELASTESEIRELGGRVLAMQVDVRDAAAVQRMVDRTLDELGRIDILVNNAGVGPAGVPEPQRTLEQFPLDVFQSMVQTNLVGPLICAQAVAPAMIRQGGGNILNVQTGQATQCRPGMGAYGMAKAGLEPMVQAMAAELRQSNIAINNLNPGGAVNTRIMGEVPAERRAAAMSPEVIVEPAIVLATQDAQGITGQSLSARNFPWE